MFSFKTWLWIKGLTLFFFFVKSLKPNWDNDMSDLLSSPISVKPYHAIRQKEISLTFFFCI